MEAAVFTQIRDLVGKLDEWLSQVGQPDLDWRSFADQFYGLIGGLFADKRVTAQAADPTIGLVYWRQLPDGDRLMVTATCMSGPDQPLVAVACLASQPQYPALPTTVHWVGMLDLRQPTAIWVHTIRANDGHTVRSRLLASPVGVQMGANDLRLEYQGDHKPLMVTHWLTDVWGNFAQQARVLEFTVATPADVTRLAAWRCLYQALGWDAYEVSAGKQRHWQSPTGSPSQIAQSLPQRVYLAPATWRGSAGE
jgi:hypothetical protein